MTDPTTRLYLVTPLLTDRALLPAFGEALAAGDVACVLLRARSGLTDADITPYVEAARQAGAVALVADDTQLASAADGVHVSKPGKLAAAIRGVKPAGIVGCGGFALRDDAMAAGESGVDYVMFGDDGAPFTERLDRASWWAEIFEIPCVACAAAMDEVEPLAAAGVEFVALSDIVWADARGPSAAVGEAMRHLKQGADRFAARLAEQA